MKMMGNILIHSHIQLLTSTDWRLYHTWSIKNVEIWSLHEVVALRDVQLHHTTISQVRESITSYWQTNALNCIKFKRLKSICINILKDN